MNCCRPKTPKSSSHPEQSSPHQLNQQTTGPKYVKHETFLTIPNCKVHLMEEGEAFELANGDFEVIRLSEENVVLATVLKVGDDLQWPLTRDEPIIKLGAFHYLFSLPVNHGEALSYGVTFPDAGKLAVLDSFLRENSCFSCSISSVQNKNLNWKEFAPAIEDYNNFLAKAIAGGTGQIVKGIFKCSNTYTNMPQFLTSISIHSHSPNSSCDIPLRILSYHLLNHLEYGVKRQRLSLRILIQRWSRDHSDATMLKMVFPTHLTLVEKGRKHPREVQRGGEKIVMQAAEQKINIPTRSGSNKNKSGLNKSLKRVRKVSKMTEKMSKTMLDGVGVVTGSVMDPVVRSQAGKSFLGMVPGEILLASLDALNKVLDAAEAAEKQTLTATSAATTRMVTKRFGDNAGEATEDVLATAGHCVGTAWNVFKIRKAINPASSVSSRVLTSTMKNKKSSC